MTQCAHLVVLSAILLLADSARAAPRMPKVEPFGLDGFRLMLQQRGMATVQLRLASAMQAPKETVIVLVGNIATAQSIRSGLTEFVENGGALLVATDLGCRPMRTDWMFGSQFAYTRMSFPRDSRLESFSDCPQVTQLEKDLGADLFAGVNTIVANRPAYLQHTKQMQTLAWLPARRHRPPRALMAMHQAGLGRMLLVADHSIFVNAMLVHGDNARFTSNVTEWLTKGGSRRRLVFVYNNRLLPEWSFRGNLPAVPLQSLLKSVERHGLAGLPVGETLFPLLNQSLTNFERHNGFNDGVHHLAKPIAKFRLGPALIVITFLLLCTALRWLFGTRGRAQQWLSTHEVGYENRLSAAVREKQYASYLRTLSREFFADAGITRFSEQANYPTVHMKRGNSKTTTREIRSFWDIATANRTVQMTHRKFQNLIAQLRNLHALRLQGQFELD